MTAKQTLSGLLDTAGIRINGDRPWDLSIHDERLYQRILAEGSLGAGEAYMEGWWDVDQLDEFFTRIQRARLETKLRHPATLIDIVFSRIGNRQSRRRSRQVAAQHYDLPSRLYERMLGETMQYTCAYYGVDGQQLDSLDAAQRNKLALIASKLDLEPGMRVLELGGGFGELARYLAAEHGCELVSYNISRQQVEFARKRCEGLPVDIRLKDYRDVAQDSGQYDRVVSIGLMEHVGPANHRGFFEIVKGRLKPGGLALIHTIGGNESRTRADAWISKYIFPGGVMPSEVQLSQAKEGLFVLEDWHNFGPDYDRTLMAWEANFISAWPELKESEGFDDRFYRMWRYYLNLSASAFRARGLNLWQIVLSHGDVDRYVPVR